MKRLREQFQHLKTDGEWTVRDDVFVTFLDRQETPVSPLHGPLTVGFGSAKNVRDKNNKRISVPGVGPELGIGWILGEALDEPVLLIKAAWGGRAVKYSFRPPSAMPTDEEIKARLAEVQKKNPDMTFAELKESYGSDYRKIISETHRVLDHIDQYVPNYDKSTGYELAGFIWFQGWNDGVGSGNPEYTEQMAHFIRDIRKDLKSPALPFVIGELGTDGKEAAGWVATFRRSRRQLPRSTNFKATCGSRKRRTCGPARRTYLKNGPTSARPPRRTRRRGRTIRRVSIRRLLSEKLGAEIQGAAGLHFRQTLPLSRQRRVLLSDGRGDGAGDARFAKRETIASRRLFRYAGRKFPPYRPPQEAENLV